MNRKMIRSSPCIIFIFVTLLVATQTVGNFIKVAEGGKISIPDELDDVIDDEEDEEWKNWGKKKPSKKEFDPPKLDLSNMEFSEIQSEMMKRHTGPSFGFVKLRLGGANRRTPDMVSEIAMKWSKVMKTGSIDVKFMGVDISTIMFTMEKGQDIMELIEFVLSQSEAYEVKIGDQVHRRPGDPPLEEVMEKIRSHKENANGDGTSSPVVDQLANPKDEL
ncbi:hypothetical protein MKW92_037171 [Papaver armeniacum]|nr:hypothetical protein MKW92_037171 [Papaver armeniacum]